MKTMMRRGQRGFSLIELMISSAVFLVVAGSVLSLLVAAQKRYQTDSQVLASFQEARLGIDQVVRDVNDSGYPPPSRFSVLPAANLYAVSPIAWDPGYTGAAPCAIGVSCATPGDFDLIIETQFDNNGVQWIRYQLPAGTTTLLRGVVPKTAGANPAAATTGAAVMLPYIQNVMNNATPAQIGAIQATYPTMFPGGNPVPVFSYTCDVPGAAPTNCPAAGASNAPANVRGVEITLIVQATTSDAQTKQLRAVELHGRGRRVNPNQ